MRVQKIRKRGLLIIVASVFLLGVVLTFMSRKHSIKTEVVSDLRGLHAASAKYLADEGQWPQISDVLRDGSEDEFFAFWQEKLRPYGATPEMWKLSRDPSMSGGSYVPSLFTGGPHTPYRWGQPWFVTRAQFDGKTHYQIMPDGAVSSSQHQFSQEKEESNVDT